MVANVLDCDILEGEFELQSPYYIHFQTDTLFEEIRVIYLVIRYLVISLSLISHLIVRYLILSKLFCNK